MQSTNSKSPQKTLPATPQVYALLARSYANLANRERTMLNVQLAEQHAQPASSDANSTGATQSEYSFPPARL